MPQRGKLSSTRNPAAPRLLSAGVKSSSFEVSPFLRLLRLREKCSWWPWVLSGPECRAEVLDLGVLSSSAVETLKLERHIGGDVRSFTSSQAISYKKTYKLISGACFPVPFVREAVRARPPYPVSGQQEDNMKSLKPEI